MISKPHSKNDATSSSYTPWDSTQGALEHAEQHGAKDNDGAKELRMPTTTRTRAQGLKIKINAFVKAFMSIKELELEPPSNAQDQDMPNLVPNVPNVPQASKHTKEYFMTSLLLP